MSETPDELATLLALARQDGPGTARLARVRERLESQLGSLDAPRPAAPPMLGLKVGLGALAVLAVVALLGIREWIGAPSEPMPERERAHPEAAAAASTRRAEPDVEPALDLRVEPAPQGAESVAPSDGDPVGDGRVEPRRVVRRAAAASPTEPPSVDPFAAHSHSHSTLREEIALLDRALRAREAGDVARAAAALHEHRARFPSGTMSPERDRMLDELDRASRVEPSTEETVPITP